MSTGQSTKQRLQVLSPFGQFIDKGKPRDEITVTFPDGKTQIVKAYETTPLQIATSLSKSLANDTVIAKVDGELWDLDRPLEKSCSLQFLKFEDEEGRA